MKRHVTAAGPADGTLVIGEFLFFSGGIYPALLNAFSPPHPGEENAATPGPPLLRVL